MIVRIISIFLLVLAVYLSTNRVEASRSKLKIHVPQRIKTIHHYHKKHYHQYARGYGYGPPCPSTGHHRASPNSVYHRGRGHSPSRYKKGRGRGRRRNYGAKRYGMYNYAGKYRNWMKYNPRWKDRRGTASHNRPRYTLPGHKHSGRPRLPQPPPPGHDDDDGGDLPDHDEDYDDGQYHEDDAEGQYHHDERITSQKNKPNRQASASEVGEKIHDSISEIIGLISKYSGHKDRDRGGLKEGYEAARDPYQGPKRSGDQRPSPTDSNQNKFGNTNDFTMNYNSYDQRQSSQYPNGVRNPQQGGQSHHGGNSYTSVPTERPQYHPQRDVFGQAFQAFSHGGRTLPIATQLGPTISYPTGSLQPGFNLNRFQGGSQFQNAGDHDIGFGQGLEVIPDGFGRRR